MQHIVRQYEIRFKKKSNWNIISFSKIEVEINFFTRSSSIDKIYFFLCIDKAEFLYCQLLDIIFCNLYYFTRYLQKLYRMDFCFFFELIKQNIKFYIFKINRFIISKY